jgi:hypothetical protein
MITEHLLHPDESFSYEIWSFFGLDMATSSWCKIPLSSSYQPCFVILYSPFILMSCLGFILSSTLHDILRTDPALATLTAGSLF